MSKSNHQITNKFQKDNIQITNGLKFRIWSLELICDSELGIFSTEGGYYAGYGQRKEH
jgi:hypothetical protein